MNRASSDRLAQAETLWAMLNPSAYPGRVRGGLEQRPALLRTHLGRLLQRLRSGRLVHRRPMDIKQSFATAANLQSRQLLARPGRQRCGFKPFSCTGARSRAQSRFDVFNTTSWTRTGTVLLPHRVVRGRRSRHATSGAGLLPVPASCQRRTGLLVRDLPPLRRPPLHDPQGPPLAEGQGRGTTGALLDNHKLRVRLGPANAAVLSSCAAGIDVNLADTAVAAMRSTITSISLATTRRQIQKNGPVKITVRRPWPAGGLALGRVRRARLLQPAAARFARDGRRRLRGTDRYGGQETAGGEELLRAKDGKESVNFAFPFHVPGGRIRLDVPFGAVRPELDQMPQRVQELADRRPLGRCRQRGLRRHLGHAGRPVGRDRRHHRDVAQFARPTPRCGGRRSSRPRSSIRGR